MNNLQCTNTVNLVSIGGLMCVCVCVCVWYLNVLNYSSTKLGSIAVDYDSQKSRRSQQPNTLNIFLKNNNKYVVN